jgi:hypothetical protein
MHDAARDASAMVRWLDAGGCMRAGAGAETWPNDQAAHHARLCQIAADASFMIVNRIACLGSIDDDGSATFVLMKGA